jgi:F0F1-type ATP synthase membrane subunit c/vacuolar-type H+-ATPase subunit K
MKNRKVLLLFLLPLTFLPFLGLAAAYSVTTLQAATTTVTGTYDKVAIAIAASLAVSLSTIAASFAISSAGTAAISALAEKPDTFFKSFLVVALAEALAIYGLIMGILLWLKL